MQNGMKLIEKINEITANSVTPEEFKKATGHSIDEHVANMMDRIHRLEGKNQKVVNISIKSADRPAARPAAKSIAAKPADAAKLEKEVTGRVAKVLEAAGLTLPKTKDGVVTITIKSGKKSLVDSAAAKKGGKWMKVIPTKEIEGVGIECIKLVESPQKGKLAGRKSTKGPKGPEGGGGPIGGGPK